VGLAAEWTRRQDHYFYKEESGSPSEGAREANFEDEGFGGQVGARLTFDVLRAGGLTVGAGLRFLPELAIRGTQDLTILSDTSLIAIGAVRESGWQGGLSLGLQATDAFQFIAGVGGQAAQEWRGFDVVSGRRIAWSIAGEYHDSRDSWSARLGIGRETQRGAPEPRADIVGLGLGWTSDSLRLDIGVVRRSLKRSDHPTSFDDRVLASVTVPL
jgi:hypothetical protein